MRSGCPSRWQWVCAAVWTVAAAIACHRISRTESPSCRNSEAVGFFANVTASSGVDFTYRSGDEANHYSLLESIGGGVALIDYDHSGRLSVFVPGGGYFDGPDKNEIRGHPCKLYKNLGNFKFQDVTEEVGLNKIDFYTHGAVAGDYNKDGWADLLVTGWGRVALLRNEDDGKGGRRFVDVTREAGLGNDHLWSTSACFMDLDGKGWPDIYVAHYLDWDLRRKHPYCHDLSGAHQLCIPDSFLPLPHSLYRNNCDGKTFTDISDSCGLRRDGKINERTGEVFYVDRNGQPVDDPAQGHEPFDGKGLAVIAVDMNNDGKPDIMVANDETNNFFYLNRSTREKIALKEMAVVLGLATDVKGHVTGNMGIACADYDRSGAPSLFITTFLEQPPCLYHNRGPGSTGLPRLDWATESAGLLAVSLENVGWGTAFVDIENRGWQDIIEVNGHIFRFPPGELHRSRLQYAVILRNSGGERCRFSVATEQGGPYFRAKHCARGLACGDLDNRGKIDLVVSSLNEPVAILKNVCNSGNHWIGIELKGADHRDIIGSRVVLESAQGKQTRYICSGGSYASSSDPRLVFGLGKDDKVDSVTVIWSHHGKEQKLKGLEVDRYWRITEGNDKAERLGD